MADLMPNTDRDDWPSVYQGCRIFGRYLDMNGRPLQGMIVLRAAVSSVTLPDGSVIPILEKRIPLDPEGRIDEIVPATDDPDTNPTGWTYEVQEAFRGGITYNIVAPVNGEVNLGIPRPSVEVSTGTLISRGPAGEPGTPGPVGPVGPSAYDVAVEQGFVGTVEEWLQTVTQGPVGPAGASGPSGPSAYELAVIAGFSGTESEWLASLAGPAGEQGPPGPQGPAGTPSVAPLSAPPSNPTMGQLWFDVDTGTLNAWYGTAWVNVSGPIGPRGSPGPQGLAGTPGPQGPPGFPSLAPLNTPPSNPLQGQLWFDTDMGTLNAWYGTAWVGVSGPIGPAGPFTGPKVSFTSTPPIDPAEGDFWFNTTTGSMNVRYGSVWVGLTR